MSANNAAEQEAFISTRNVKQTKMQAFTKFCYNAEDGTCMGRSGKSWGQILGFYLIFYACLAGFFAICLSVFMTTIKENEPRWFGKGSIMGANPGLGFQPWLIDDPDSTLIKFTPGEGKPANETYAKYVTRLRQFLKPYMNVENKKKCPKSDDEAHDEPCSYYDTIMKALEHDTKCREGIEQASDAKGRVEALDNCFFGYREGTPVVMLTLNRMLQWKPEQYTNEDKYTEGQEDEAAGKISKAGKRFQKEILAASATNHVFLTCEGQFAADKDNIGEVKFTPEHGLPFQFFPYVNYKQAEFNKDKAEDEITTYDQPIGFVQFKSPPAGVIVLVECKAWAKNIAHDRMHKLGIAHFEVLVEHMQEEE